MSRSVRQSALAAGAVDRAAGLDDRSSRYDEKQRHILRAATVAFNRKGVHGANLTEIARAVGLTTASITYYYKKKEQLAAACFLEAIATYQQIIRSPQELTNSRERIEALVKSCFELWRDITLEQRDRPMLFDDIRTLTKPHSLAVGQAYTEMFRDLRALLFRDHPRETLSQLERNARAHLVLQCLLWLPAWTREHDPADFRFDADHFADLLINGFAAARWRAEAAVPAIRIAPRTAGSREAFLTAATHLINAHGYHGASVDKISAYLSVSKGSFYHHNETKDELVLACFERTLQIMDQAQSEGRALPASGIDRLRATCAALAEFQLSDGGPLLRSTALLALPETLRHSMIVRMNRVSRRFADMITDGVIDGSIRRINARIGGQLVNPMINGAASLSRWAPGVTAGTVVPSYVDPLLRGVLAATA